MRAARNGREILEELRCVDVILAKPQTTSQVRTNLFFIPSLSLDQIDLIDHGRRKQRGHAFAQIGLKPLSYLGMLQR
jgi:hypothetical protein